jgi:hypothetical protein
MTVNLATKPTLTANLRIVSGFIAALSAAGAALSIFRGTGVALQLSLGCAGVVAWGSLAFFGNKPGWSRTMTLAAFVVFVALTACKLAGVAV